MLVKLFDGRIRTSPAMLERVRQRVSHALDHLAQRVIEVTVRLADENSHKPSRTARSGAARGGPDKRCRIVAQIAGTRPIVVEAHHADYYRAVDAAAAKLERAAEHRRTRSF